MTTRSRIIRVIAEELDRTEDSISDNHNLRSDLGMDSLDAHNVMIGIEEEFQIELAGKTLPDEKFIETATVNDVLRLVGDLL